MSEAVGQRFRIASAGSNAALGKSRMLENQIELGVDRDFENRRQNEPDDGPLARIAHEKRRSVLEADLAEPAFTVLDWGDAKDTEPHEFVAVLIAVLSSPVVHAAAVPARLLLEGYSLKR